jgi:predicted nucleic acid-binding protein
LSTFFVDTSALAKRYLAEIGSDWVHTWVASDAGNQILVSEITLAEMRSLLARRVREGLPAEAAAAAKLAFARHFRREYRVIRLNRSCLQLAGELTETYLLRTLDAIHLAGALQARSSITTPITFISADKNQRNAAAAEGFAVDDPHAHP